MRLVTKIERQVWLDGIELRDPLQLTQNYTKTNAFRARNAKRLLLTHHENQTAYTFRLDLLPASLFYQRRNFHRSLKLVPNRTRTPVFAAFAACSPRADLDLHLESLAPAKPEL